MLMKSERMKYKRFTAEEKIRCMDSIIKYCKENARSIYDDSARDLYEVCKVVAGTTLFDFIAEHVIDEE